MKTFILTTLLSLNTFASAVEIIKSSKETIVPSSIESVISMIPSQPDKKVQFVVTNHGMSTDVSPRFSVYLGYATLAEMGNINADFEITSQAFDFISATRKSAGHYVVKTKEYGDEGMHNVTYEIDATQMFVDEKKTRKNCGGDFCDVSLETSISVKRTAKKCN